MFFRKNCVIDVDLEKYLPGPYTIILKKKNKGFLSHVSETNSIGVRIPDCDFTKEIQLSKVPFITTSVNFSGEKPASEIKEIPEEIINQADCIFNAGKLTGNPSTIIINEKEIKR